MANHLWKAVRSLVENTEGIRSGEAVLQFHGLTKLEQKAVKDYFETTRGTATKSGITGSLNTWV